MHISIQTGHIFSLYGAEEGSRLIRESGFDAVDWSLPGWSAEVKATGVVQDHILEKEYEEILSLLTPEIEAIRKAGLVIGQAHAPFPAYTTIVPEFLDRSIEVYKKCIRLCDAAGCPYMVLHGIKTRKNEETPTVEEAAELNQKLFESLIPTLKECKVVLCMENLFTGTTGNFYGSHCADAGQAAELIDGLNQKAGREVFALCLDTGHLHLARVDMRQYMPRLGGRIKALHIDDNFGVNDNHLEPYGGAIRWDHFCDQLKKIGYAHSLNFEVSTSHVPEPLLAAYIRYIAEIGKYFKSIICA